MCSNPPENLLKCSNDIKYIISTLTSTVKNSQKVSESTDILLKYEFGISETRPFEQYISKSLVKYLISNVPKYQKC